MIKITICGFCVDAGKPTQRGGAVAKLVSVDEQQRTAKRTIQAATGNSTRPQSELKAALLGLLAVSQRQRQNRVEFGSPKYVSDFLEKVDGKYKRVDVKSNVELITKLRTVFDAFSDISLAVDKDEMKEALQLSKETAEKQDNKDSGTVCNIEPS